MSPASPPASPNRRWVTTRCNDCSRESKRYVSGGMKTEISVNPLLQMDSICSTSLQNTHSTLTHSKIDKLHLQPHQRSRPSVIQRPLPIQSHGILYSSMHRKDYMSAVPAMGVKCYQRLFHHNFHLRRLPMIQVNPQCTHVKYRPVEANDVKNRCDVHVAYHNRHSPVFARRSPTFQRSPPIHNMMKNDLFPPHCLRSRSSVLLHESYVKPYANSQSMERYYSNRKSTEEVPVYKNPLTKTTPKHPALSAEQASAVETQPPVYVIPNDFDVRKESLEPHIFDYHPMKSQSSTSWHGNREIDLEQSKLPLQSKPTASSVKSVDELQRQRSNAIVNTFLCKICKKTFSTKSALYKHLRGHSSDEKPFRCKECGQGFTLSSNLQQHGKIHRGYKPFDCEYCGKTFMRSNVYKQHRCIHTGEQIHKCRVCPSKFLRQHALIKHIKKAHNMETSEN